jgi:iron(III) transport system ATP-binding protein
MTLSLRNIRHAYGAVPALAGASLDVEPQEIVSLCGPSGCGKTTLLRIAAGLERLQAGAVLLNGDVLGSEAVHIPPERRPVGFVFQDFVLFPHLTVFENVAFGLAGLSRSEKEDRARQELAALDLVALARRFPHQLSGGQQQRVALARALVRRPRAMLLDEPFGSLDPVLRRRLRVELRRILRESGAATILVTHDSEEALALGDCIAVMREGVIVEVGTPQELYRAPKTADAAGLFVGAQRFRARRRGGVLETGLGAVSLPGNDGEVDVVALPGALRARPKDAGLFAVAECRFEAPVWSVAFVAGTDVRLNATATEPLAPGARLAVDIDPGLLRVFPV